MNGLIRELKVGSKLLTVETVKRASKYIVLTGNDRVDFNSIIELQLLKDVLDGGVQNDIAKYNLLEAYKTSLVMTINARALQNFLELRSSKHALWEIQLLAKAIYDVIPDDHKFLYDYIFKDNNEK